MSRNKFLTPDSLEGESLCYQISIPVRLFEFVLGALLPLGETWQWEKEGDVEPADAAEYFSEWIYDILDTECIEPMETALLSRTTAFSVPHNELTPVSFTSSVYNSDYFTFDGEVLNCNLAGLYAATAQMYWASNTTGVRQAGLLTTGASQVYLAFDNRLAQTGYGSPGGTLSFVRRLAANTQFRLAVFQTSGSPLNLGQSNLLPYLNVVRLRD